MTNSELLIECFTALDCWNPGAPEPTIEIGGSEMSLGKAIGRLWHDADFIPNRFQVWVAEYLDRHDDRRAQEICTYAQAARVLKAARNRALDEHSAAVGEAS